MFSDMFPSIFFFSIITQNSILTVSSILSFFDCTEEKWILHEKIDNGNACFVHSSYYLHFLFLEFNLCLQDNSRFCNSLIGLSEHSWVNTVQWCGIFCILSEFFGIHSQSLLSKGTYTWYWKRKGQQKSLAECPHSLSSVVT